MKKFLVFMLSIMMAFCSLCLTACGNNPEKYLDHRHNNDLYPGDVCDKCNSRCVENWELLNGIGNYIIMDTGEGLLIEFYDNISLNYIHINEDWSSRVKYVYIAPEVTEIPSEAFECSCLQYVALSEGLEIIGDYAFLGCEELKEITLPEGLEIIGESAFASCEELEHVSLPDSLIKIENSAFYNTSIKDIELGPGLLKIGYGAFADTNIRSISIPENVVIIGKCAFMDSKLKNISIGKGVNFIGAKAFSGCNENLKITFEEKENWFVQNEYHDAISIDKSAISGKKDAGQLFLSKYCAYNWLRAI